MSEELLHAFLAAFLLEIHIYEEILRVVVSVRPLQHHLYIVDCAQIAFADVDHDARIFILDQYYLVGFTLRLQGDIRLRYYELLIVDLAGDFYNGI